MAEPTYEQINAEAKAIWKNEQMSLDDLWWALDERERMHYKRKARERLTRDK